MYKQPPIWIINSTLLLFFISTLIFILCTGYKIPKRVPLVTTYVPVQEDNESLKIDITQIYQNDLFNTYKEAPAQEIPQEEKKIQLPLPPELKTAQPIQAQPIRFLEPLAITLKGIIFSTHEEHNRAIIQDNKSHEEKLYKVGDAIEDAEMVRIYYNKIMLIRSNGQQETIFMSAQDEQKDPMHYHEIVWHNIIHQKSAHEFMIDKKACIENIKNLAEFIDMLDITTAFKKGKTIGCRVGVLKPNSIGPALGLMPNDIILSVQDIPTTTTNDRVEIFTQIKNMQQTDVISVKILRQGNEIVQKYELMPEVTLVEPQKGSLPDVPDELQHIYNMSNTLVEESQTHKNPMVDLTHANNLSAMNEAPTEESTLLQQVPT